jgi:hypothetical protein
MQISTTQPQSNTLKFRSIVADCRPLESIWAGISLPKNASGVAAKHQ